MPTPYRETDDPAYRACIQKQVVEVSRKTWYHSIDLPGGRVIEGLVPVSVLRQRIEAFPMPADLSGKRVLDIGAATGWCSFEMERRGASVVAVDCVPYPDFHEARDLLGSKVEYHVLDMEEISPAKLGLFDYVLFFGVLYHLRHPLLGLEIVCSLAKEAAFVESFVIDSQSESDEKPMLQFFPTDELGGQIDNWYGPNPTALAEMCRAAGFATAKLEYRGDRRAGVTCRRRWDLPHGDPALKPWVNSAVNNRDFDRYFHQGKDEYICLYFNSTEPELNADQVFPEIDGYGAPLLTLADLGRSHWQANLKAPAWLEPGPHPVRVRTLASTFSDTFHIEVLPKGTHKPPVGETELADFLPLGQTTEPAPEISEVENSVNETATFHGFRNEVLNVRFRSPDESLTKAQVQVEVAGIGTPVLYLTRLWDNRWQTNSKLPPELTPGIHQVRVRTHRSPFSKGLGIQFEPGER